jgi:predicted Zn-dependent protease
VEGALALEPLSHHIWLNFGKMLHAQGRHVEAVAAFRAAQAADPNDNISTVFLAQALEALGERQVAFHILMSVMEKEPDGGYPMHVLGRVMSRGGHVKEGVELLARVAQVVPEMPAVQIDLGRALLAANEPFEAVERAEAAMKLAPADGGPLALRARCHEEMGEADEARKVIDRAVREHPDCPEVLREHAMLSFEHEDWAASLASWLRLQRVAPENLEAVWGESFIRYIEGDKARFAKLAPLLRANRPELGAWWTSAPWPEERGKRISLARFFMRRLQDVGPQQTADAMPPVGEA